MVPFARELIGLFLDVFLVSTIIVVRWNLIFVIIIEIKRISWFLTFTWSQKWNNEQTLA